MIRFAKKDEQPVVSVCIITYNHEKFIEAAINSVLMQETDFPCEIIIADDCSKDSTREILNSFAEQYPIKLILQEKNIGAALNWRTLMEAPSGKYVAYFEGDDEWIDPLKLKKQFAVLEQDEELVLCYANAKIVDTKNAQSTIYFKPNNKPPVIKSNYEAVDFCPMPTCTVFFRNMLNPMPEWVNSIFAGDYILVALLCKYGGIYYIDECMGLYNHHYAGVSRTIQFKNFYYVDAPLRLNLVKHYDNDPVIIKTVQEKYFNSIDMLFHLREFRLAIRLFWKSKFWQYLLKTPSLWSKALKTAVKIHFLFFLSKNKSFIYRD